MRKLHPWIVLALALSLAACTSHKTESTSTTTTGAESSATADAGSGAGPAATAEASESDKTVTVTTKEGTATSGQGAVDLSSLGVPIYPGAKEGEGSFSVKGATGSGAVTTLSTPDSFDKVYEWYKSQLPADSEKMKISAGGASTAEFVVAQSEDKSVGSTVTISQKGSEATQIIITKSSK